MAELTGLMAGGSELEELTHELEQAGGEGSGLREVAQVFEQEVAELHVAELGAGRTPPSEGTDTRQDPTQP
jgi:hypothetical protein